MAPGGTPIRFLNELESEVQAITDLPGRAEEPVVREHPEEKIPFNGEPALLAQYRGGLLARMLRMATSPVVKWLLFDLHQGFPRFSNRQAWNLAC